MPSAFRQQSSDSQVDPQHIAMIPCNSLRVSNFVSLPFATVSTLSSHKLKAAHLKAAGLNLRVITCPSLKVPL